MFRKLTISLALTLVMVSIMSHLFAKVAYALPEDGRINLVSHFGGDVLYCVDQDFNPTNHYPDLEQGGFRLLDMHGQVLWFVPAAPIAAAVQEARETGATVLAAEGMGTYGPVYIHAYVTGAEDAHFIFTGYDEHGRPNSLTFQDCIPVGPALEQSDDDDTPRRLPGTDVVICPGGQEYNKITGECESYGVIDIGPGISSDDGLPV